jgi:hypothetical protein
MASGYVALPAGYFLNFGLLIKLCSHDQGVIEPKASFAP